MSNALAGGLGSARLGSACPERIIMLVRQCTHALVTMISCNAAGLDDPSATPIKIDIPRQARQKSKQRRQSTSSTPSTPKQAKQAQHARQAEQAQQAPTFFFFGGGRPCSGCLIYRLKRLHLRMHHTCLGALARSAISLLYL